ncbi:MAG: hypothetical protein WCR04_11720 [Fibrobacteraceae bacterium]
MKDKKTLWVSYTLEDPETSWESNYTVTSPRSEENDEPWWYDEK